MAIGARETRRHRGRLTITGERLASRAGQGGLAKFRIEDEPDWPVAALCM